MKRKKLLVATLMIGLLIALFPPAATAAPSPSSPSQPPVCNPMAAFLADLLGVECEYLMVEYQANGIGFGVIMKAYFLSTLSPDLDWEDLVARHMSEEGLGWGQVMKAYTLASLLGLDGEELLEQHRGGMGWGQILKQYREGPGKPPWAGQGPLPWAHRGKPPWAGPHKPTE